MPSPRPVVATLVALAAALTVVTPASAASRTYVSFGFDGAFQSQVAAGEMFLRHGMRATYYATSGKAGRGTVATFDQLRALAGAGFEVGGHTLDQVRLDDLPPAEQRRQVCDDREALLRQGLNARSFSFPFGRSTAVAKQAARDCGYSTARTTTVPIAGRPELIPPRDRYATLAKIMRRVYKISDYQRLVKAAERSGRTTWVQFAVPQVCECGMYSISPGRLELFLTWLEKRADRGTLVEPSAGVLGLQPRLDHARPQVRVQRPRRATLVRGRTIAVQARASDDKRVRQVRFFVDGRSVGTDRTAPYTRRWRTAGARRGTHTLRAVATDTSGKTRSHAIRVGLR